MEIVGKSQVALGTETLVIDLKFDITQRIMPNWLSN